MILLVKLVLKCVQRMPFDRASALGSSGKYCHKIHKSHLYGKSFAGGLWQIQFA